MTRSALTILRIASLAVIVLGASDANAAQPAEIAGVWLNPKANTRASGHAALPCAATSSG
jgi:hypothetical protein